MTSYAGEQEKINSWLVSVEIWSYNHKFLRTDLFIPDNLRKYSQQIEENIRSKLNRGKVAVKINLFDIEGVREKEVSYNQHLAKEIYDIGRKEKKKGENSLQMKDILLIPGVIEVKQTFLDFGKLWPKIDSLISKTLTKLIKIKKLEGKNASKELRKIISNINNSLNNIKKIHKKEKSEFSKVLKQKVENISSIKVDKEALQEEAVNFIRSYDISEEISRIVSYLDFLKDLLKSKTAVGRKIDFIAQELLREINTIGAKKDNFDIKREVVNVKEEVEKIREQSQNVE